MLSESVPITGSGSAQGEAGQLVRDCQSLEDYVEEKN